MQPSSRDIRAGSDRVRDKPAVAGFLHNVYAAGLISQINFTEIPEGKRDRGERPDFYGIDHLKTKFFGKEIDVGEHWPAIRGQIEEGLHAYHWVCENRDEIDVLAVWNDEYPKNRGAIYAAKDNGIPTVEVCHGSIYIPKHGHHGARKICDIQCGTENYRWFHEVMGAKGEVRVTGSIEMDIYARANIEQLRTTSRTELEIDSSAPVVTFLGDAVFERNSWQDKGMGQEIAVHAMRSLGQLQGMVADLQLIIKPHPYEQVAGEAYSRALHAAGVTTDYTVITDHLALALAPADLIVGRPSSAMAAALRMGIPCVILAYEPWMPLQMWEGKGCVAVEDPGVLLNAMGTLLMDNERMVKLIHETWDGAEYFAGPPDGSAASRIAEVIESAA